MWIFISGFTGLILQNQAFCGTIKDTESASASHADTAAIPVVLKTYDFPGVKIVQFNLAVLSQYSYTVVSGKEAMVVDPARDIGAYVDLAKKEGWTIKGVFLSHSNADFVADRLLAGDPALMLVDIRTPEEYAQFHIRSAVNIPEDNIFETLMAHKNKGHIVLYANGTTNAAQVRNSLIRAGFQNVGYLTDGLEGFLEGCLKPVSLRTAPLSPDAAAKINAWRAFFLGSGGSNERAPMG